MNRYLRVALLVLALVVVVAGTALANRGKADEHRSPNAASHEPETSAAEKAGTETSSDAISSKLLDRIVASLADQGITTDADTVRTWAEKVGVGGAVRLLTWADASGKTPAEIQEISKTITKHWLRQNIFGDLTFPHGGFLAGLCIYLVYLGLRGFEAVCRKGRAADGLVVRFGLMGAAAVAAHCPRA